MKFGVAVSIVKKGYVEVEADSEAEAKALVGEWYLTAVFCSKYCDADPMVVMGSTYTEKI